MGFHSNDDLTEKLFFSRNIVVVSKNGKWRQSTPCLIRFTPCAICSSCHPRIYEVLHKGINWLIQIEPFWTIGFNSEQTTEQKNWALIYDPKNSTVQRRTSLIFLHLQYYSTELKASLYSLIMKMNQSIIQRLPMHRMFRMEIRVITSLNILSS